MANLARDLPVLSGRLERHRIQRPIADATMVVARYSPVEQ